MGDILAVCRARSSSSSLPYCLEIKVLLNDLAKVSGINAISKYRYWLLLPRRADKE